MSSSGGEAPARAVAPPRGRYAVDLLDGFTVTDADRPVALPASEQRVVAYLALRGKPIMRTRLAETLWLDSDPAQAAGALRSTVHRIRRRAPGLIADRNHALSIPRAVTVDVHRADRAVDGLLRAREQPAGPPWPLELLTSELLPGWYEDWIVVERERLRQRFMHALEAVAEFELRRNNAPGGIEAALAAVAMEPLRETPRRLLVTAHMSEGNPSEAIREYERYTELLRAELGIAPTAEFRALLPAGALADG